MKVKAALKVKADSARIKAAERKAALKVKADSAKIKAAERIATRGKKK